MKVFYAFSIFTMLAFGMSPDVFSQELTGADQKKFEQAYSYIDEGNNRKAISILRGIYKNTPENIDVCYNLGMCYLNMSGNPDSAAFFLEKVLELDKDEWSSEKSELMFAVGRVRQLKYDHAGALKIYDEIEKHDAAGEWKAAVEHERFVCENAKVMMASPVKLEVRRLDDNVNSKWSDYRPVISADQNTLIFTSRRKKAPRTYFEDGEGEEMSFICERKDGKWSKAERIEGLFAKKGQISSTCLSGNELYIVHDGDIYVSQKDSVSGKWTQAKNIGYPINSRGEEKYAYVTEDGSEMFFSSRRDGGLGAFDIYHSYRLPNGEWGVPKNLGSGINTPGDEDAPVMHPNKPILYFSSTGHNTMGGYDIFYAIENPADSTFEAVKNIGYPINTPDDDLYFVPTAVKDMAYYASIKWDSNAESFTGYDIYEVEYDEPEVNKLVIMSGKVLSSQMTSVNITAEVNGEVIGRYIPNPETGKYVIIGDEGVTYDIKVSNGDMDQSLKVSTSVGDSYYKLGRTIPISDVSFVDQEEQSVAAVAIEHQQPIDSAIARVASDGKGGYTVQVFSLREPVNMKRVKNLDPTQLNEYKYKDGWYVYSYGHYDTYAGAKKTRDLIVETSPYIDAFVRRISAYNNFIY